MRFSLELSIYLIDKTRIVTSQWSIAFSVVTIQRKALVPVPVPFLEQVFKTVLREVLQSLSSCNCIWKTSTF